MSETQTLAAFAASIQPSALPAAVAAHGTPWHAHPRSNYGMPDMSAPTSASCTVPSIRGQGLLG